MPFGANFTATVTNIRYDGGTDTDIRASTVLAGVSWNAKQRETAGKGGLSGASVYQMRIFVGRTTAAAQDGQYGPVPAEDKYLEPDAWNTQAPAESGSHWTLRPGDKIQCGETTATILAVHDNRAGRRGPHWYVEAQ